MNTVNVYLIFNGNCAEAFNYYKSVFGGDFAYIGTFGEMPPQEGKKMSEQDKKRIMHVTLPVSKDTCLMGSDSTAESGDVVFGNNFSVSVNASDKMEADRLFAQLSAGGAVIMPMNNTFWGAYFGMCTDKFGINWMVNFDTKPQQ